MKTIELLNSVKHIVLHISAFITRHINNIPCHEIEKCRAHFKPTAYSYTVYLNH